MRAPVLAGVAVLSGAAGSFPVALAIGGAYVGGMVAPLALVALLWDKRRERASRILTDRQLWLRVGPWRREIALGNALSGFLMIAMGVLAMVLAFTGPEMPSGGWQTELSAWLQHISTVAVRSLSWFPGWVVLVAFLGGLVLLLRRVLRSRAAPASISRENRSEVLSTIDTVEGSQRDQDQW